MLRTETMISITGTSITEDGMAVSSMVCTISANGRVSTSTNVINEDLYEANKEMVRNDEDEFKAYCREFEDLELLQDAEAQEV